jgi:hypothetical protein
MVLGVRGLFGKRGHDEAPVTKAPPAAGEAEGH